MIVGLVLVLIGFVLLFILPIPGVVLLMLGGLLFVIGIVFKLLKAGFNLGDKIGERREKN